MCYIISHGQANSKSTAQAAPGIRTEANIMTKINQQAMNALTAALAACNTAESIEGTVAQYLRQWGASERQIKIYPNGLAKVHVLDKDLTLIGEYTRPAIGVFAEHQDDAGYGVSEQVSLQCLVEFAAGIEQLATEDQSEIGGDVFGPDTRSVIDRREGMARQLRQLAKMATGLAEKIEA